MPLKKQILLVDDVEDFADLMKMELEAWGFEVTTAYDGEQGLQKAQQKNPDLILLDIMMPKMNGFEMYLALKKDPRFKETIVVIVSGKGDEETRQKAKEMGINAYLCKTELQEKLKPTLDHFLGGN